MLETNNMLIVSRRSGGGWLVKQHVERVFAKCLGAEVVESPADRSKPRAVRAYDLIIGRRRRGEVGIVVAASPSELLRITHIPNWRTRFSVLVAFVIDSWYHDWYSPECRLFDAVFVSRQCDVNPVQARIRPPVHYLPLGVDAMLAGRSVASADPDRPVDLLAYGRQPFSYDLLVTAAKSAGVRVRAHVPQDSDPDRNQQNLFTCGAAARFALGYCNTVHYHAGAPVTSTPFVTFRWLDNLAAGATMVGVAPKTAGVDELIGWDGACVTLPAEPIECIEGVARLAAGYDPTRGLRNHYESLVRNDWRLRLRSLLSTLGISLPDALARELEHHEKYRHAIEKQL